MNPEKHGITVGLKIMSACLPLRNVICSLKICVLTSISKLNLSG